MAARVCSTTGCPNLTSRSTDGTTKGGRCGDCKRGDDKRHRPGPRYTGTKGHRRFREAILARDPICVECLHDRATVADHWPLERWELIEANEDPNDPKHGRGLCKRCHDSKTAKTYGFGGAH